MITRHNLSMALFATGWTYESLPESDDLFDDFLNKDSTFWLSLWPYLYTHPINDYFQTNFYIGLDQVYLFFIISLIELAVIFLI